MKHCVNCGVQNTDNAKFCTECGASLQVADTNNNTGYTYEPIENEVVIHDTASSEDKYSYTYNNESNNQTNYSTVHPGIAPRNIVVAILLSIVTCGIYQLYWMYKMNEEVNELSGNQLATSGGLVILFHFITCGIYGIYWSYKMGERCDEIKGSVGGSSHILYLILTLLGFGIVTFCLIQDTINKAA